MKYKKEYFDLIKNHLKGESINTALGKSDITTPDLHAHVLAWRHWNVSIGKLLLINKAAPRTKMQMYMFEQYAPDKKQEALTYLQSFGIDVFDIVRTSASISITDLQTNTNTVLKYIDETPVQEVNESIAFTINLDTVAKQLGIVKYKIIERLKRCYKLNVDYTKQKAPNPNKKTPYSNNYTLYMLTDNCYKNIIMLSRTKNANELRQSLFELKVQNPI